MLTEKDYCDKDTAFALQELGYNPYMFYDEGTPAIHLWYAQKFLREEKSIYVTVGCPQIMNEGLGWSYEVCDKPWNGYSER